MTMRPLLSLLAFGLLVACATVTGDTNQTIPLTTNPVGAACTASNALGQWSLATTPGSLDVKRSYSPLVVTCAKGKAKGAATLQAFTNDKAWWNIALLGIPAVVDAGTGDGYEYRPESLEITLIK